MNYKEMVEHILKHRKEIVCVEAALLEDFQSHDADIQFVEWCSKNKLSCSVLTGSIPTKIVLKKEYDTQLTSLGMFVHEVVQENE